MKRGKPIILLLTVLLAAIAAVFGANEIGMRNFPFSVMVTTGENREEIRCIKLLDEYYLFLPDYAGDENLKIQTKLRENLHKLDVTRFKIHITGIGPGHIGTEDILFLVADNINAHRVLLQRQQQENRKHSQLQDYLFALFLVCNEMAHKH